MNTRLSNLIILAEAKAKYINEIKNIVIFCSSIDDNQLEKNTSVTMLYNRLSKMNLNVYLMNPDKVQLSESNDNYYLSYKDDKPIQINTSDTYIFYRRGKPESTYGLNLLKQLGSFGFICINPYDAIMTSNDKYQSFLQFEKNQIATPTTELISLKMTKEDLEGIINNKFKNKFPVILKVLDGSKGKGVIKCNDFNSLYSTAQALLLTNKNGLLIQEFIENDGDYRIHIVNNEVIASMKRESGKGKHADFRANISLGGTGKAVKDLPENMRKLAVAANNAIGCIWSGVDVIIDKKSKKPYVIEINASPGLIGISESSQIDIIKAIFDELPFVDKRETVGIYNRITIGEFGEFDSLLDTGNRKSSLSLHAENIKIDDVSNKVTFTINGKTYTRDLVKTIRVKDNEDSETKRDKRPVIKENVIFRNKLYEDILIDLNNRTHKNFKVLVNLDFIKLANIKIDVSKDKELK